MVMLVGSWMQSTAQGYLVYELTGSTTYLGIVSFAAGVPSWLFTLYGGVIADRFPRRTLIMITQAFAMFLALFMSGLIFSGLIQPWMIVGLAFLLGTSTAFEGPVRQAFLSELVDREDIPNGIALNSTMFNLGTVTGPAIGGLIYAAVGPGWCFLINGISFSASLISLALIRVAPMPASNGRGSARAQFLEGFRYTIHNSQIRYLIVGMGMIGIFTFGTLSLLPAWARDVMGGDATTYGLLNSARGLGSLIGALMVASLSHLPIRGRIWTVGSLILPVSLLVFTQIRWLPGTLLALVIIGWSAISQGNTSNALIQLNTPDHLRGRVMGFFTLVFQGGMPIGSLLSGTIAEKIGAPLTILGAAFIFLTFALYTWFRRPDLRRME